MSCSGCAPNHGCGTCLSNAKIKARAHNPVSARPGDLVEIHMDGKAIYLSALILYGIPLTGLIIGAIMGASMGSTWFDDESLAAALFGLAGIGTGFILAVIIGNSNYAKTRLTPTITRILTPVIPKDNPIKS